MTTLLRHETPHLAPRTIHEETVIRYELAYACSKKDFLEWHEEAAIDADGLDSEVSSADPSHERVEESTTTTGRTKV